MQAVSALASQHGITLPITAQARAFLDALWLPLPAGSLVGITASDVYQKDGVWKSTTTPAWSWLDDFRESGDEGTGEEALLVWAAEKNTARYPIDGGGSIYFHPAARKHFIASQYRKRGGLDDLTHLAAFYADVDVLAGGLDPEATLKRLLGLAPKPSIILWSGGGWQVYYLLNEAWDVSTRGAAVEYKAYARALFAPIKDIADPSVYEASREMRLPGFINRKAARNGAMAQLVYWSPDTRYSIDQIKEFAPIPPKLEMVGDPLPRPDTPDGTYRVGQDFIHYAVNRNRPPERHPILLQLALQAARGGMPKTEALPRLRTLALEWYRSEEHRAEQELDNLTRWSYDRLAETGDEDTGYTGSWLVRLTDSGWEQPPSDVQEQDKDATVPLEVTGAKQTTYSLAEIRERLKRHITRYLTEKYSREGSYTLLRNSPGAGKSYLTISTLAEIGQKKVKTALLTLFKSDESEWQKQITEHGIDPTDFGYFVGRNEDEHSAGYCALYKQSVALGAKNYPIRATLCARCPALIRANCESQGYLAQFTKSEKVLSLIGRHNHGSVAELMDHREVVVFDESPLEHVATALSLTVNDITFFGASQFVQEQLPTAVETIHTFVNALRNTVASVPPRKGRYATAEEIKLGGRWLFEQLVMRIGHDALAQIFALDLEFIKNVTAYPLSAPTDDAIAAMPLNWLSTAFSILKYEYETHWLNNTTSWNSRAIVIGNTISFYPMEPFSFAQGVKIIVTDATGLPSQYAIAFAYKKSKFIPDPDQPEGPSADDTEDEDSSAVQMGFEDDPRSPSEAMAGDPITPAPQKKKRKKRKGTTITTTHMRIQKIADAAALTPQSKVIQFTGTNNSRNMLHEWKDSRKNKAERYIKQHLGTEGLQIATTNGELINTEQVLDEDQDVNSYVRRIMALIVDVAKQHNGSVLVVCYKTTVNKLLLKWNEEYKILNPDYIQWFGNLRGKNTYKDLNAVIVAGTPNIPPFDVLIQAQVWHWQDSIPIDPHTRMWRILPYTGYVDPVDGLGRGYQYLGYADDRIDAIYVNQVRAELRQVYERIRPNASYDAQGKTIQKHVYLATAFPCADHVDVLQSWSTYWIDSIGRAYYEDRINADLVVHRDEFIKHVAQNADCTYNTAKACFDRIHREFDSAGLSVTAAEKKLPIEAVLDWLAADPARRFQSSRKISEATGQSRGAVMRALSRFEENI